jgi:hypothetical protein
MNPVARYQVQKINEAIAELWKNPSLTDPAEKLEAMQAVTDNAQSFVDILSPPTP